MECDFRNDLEGLGLKEFRCNWDHMSSILAGYEEADSSEEIRSSATVFAITNADHASKQYR